MLINPDTLRSRARRRRKIHVERIQMLITPDPPRSRDGDGERRTDIESTVTAKYSMSNVFNMLITLRTHSDREHGDGEKHTTRSNVLTNAANAMTDPNKRCGQSGDHGATDPSDHGNQPGQIQEHCRRPTQHLEDTSIKNTEKQRSSRLHDSKLKHLSP